VNHQSSGAVQFVQQRGRRLVEAVLVHGQRTEFDQAHAQFVVTADSAQPAQLNQPVEHAVCRRPRQPGASYHLGQRQPAGTVEGVEHQGDAVDDGAGGGGFDGQR